MRTNRIAAPWICVSACLIAACQSTPDTTLSSISSPNGAESDEMQALATPPWRVCSAAFDPSQASGFRHWRNALAAAAGAHYNVTDAIGWPGQALSVKAKFTFGALHADMRGEDVRVFVNDCAGWNLVTKAVTNDDGAVSATVTTPDADVGRFELVEQVPADASVVTASVHALPPGTHFVVFDIDGTLTINNEQVMHQVISDLLNGTYIPRAYSGAVALTQAWRSKGYVPIYLTGRPWSLTSVTRTWLASLGFASGHLQLAEDSGSLAPTNDAVGNFKRDFLRRLQDLGYIIDYAYGNESTDAYAYHQVGIPLTQTFIIGPHAGVDGTQGLSDGYDKHLDYVNAAPAASQPFTE